MNPRSHRRSALASLGVAVALAAATPPTFGGGTLDVPGPLDLTIQEAVDIAEDLGVTQLNIAPGVYAESVTLPVNGYDLVLMGNPAEPGQVVIDPSAAGLADSAVHILHGQTAATQLIGLTLRGGNADGIDDGDAFSDERGGGLFVNGSSVTVIDCVFQDNVASGFGGACYSTSGSSASFTRCQFIGNQSNLGGVVYINNGTLTLTDCSFAGNAAVNGVGGCLRTQVTTVIDRCTFEGNTSSSNGGAIWWKDGGDVGATLTVLRSTFVGSEGALGGAIYLESGAAAIRDTIMNGNTAGNTGSAIYVLTAASLTLVNATVAHNSGGNAIFGSGPKTVRSSVLWNNGGGTIGGGTNDVGFSLINVDPLFVDAAGQDGAPGTIDDDLRLLAGSPAIDAGDSSAVIGEYPVDLDGHPRAVDDPDTVNTGLAVLGLSVDCGAYEFHPAAPSPTCPGDLDGDGMVGVTDLVGLVLSWGVCP